MNEGGRFRGEERFVFSSSAASSPENLQTGPGYAREMEGFTERELALFTVSASSHCKRLVKSRFCLGRMGSKCPHPPITFGSIRCYFPQSLGTSGKRRHPIRAVH